MKLLFLILGSFLDSVTSECPSSSQLIKPCTCNSNRIACDGEFEYSLRGVFDKLSRHSSDDSQQFDEFLFNNTEITELDPELFGPIKFKQVRIVDALSLRRIAPNAFSPNADSIESFIVQGESLLGDDSTASDLFDALNSLVGAKKIWMNRNKLRSIPTVAFGKRPETDFQLEELNFNKFSSKNGNIRRIGNFAFYYLNSLQYLYLSHQKISHLSSNAFDFERSSNSTLYIYLGNNKLNNTSFERGIFLGSKRPVYLELYWNPDLTFLDENVFAPFLQAHPANRISLQDNPLQCDCNSYWMVRDKEMYKGQLLNVMCKIGPKQVFSIDLIPFDKCANSTQTRRSKSKITVVN